MNDSNSRLVYSTDSGRIDEPKAAPGRPQGDGARPVAAKARACV